MQFEVRRTIRAQKEEVFESLLDLDAAKGWMQGLVGIERLDEGSLKEGSQWLETRKMYGTKATEHFEVKELQRPNKAVFYCDGKKGTTGKGEFIFTYTLTSAGDATDITLHGEINGMTGLAKLFGKMMVSTFSKACAKDLDALKSYMEANPKSERGEHDGQNRTL